MSELTCPTSKPLQISRIPELAAKHPAIKDPCVVKMSDGNYLMFASVGSSVTEEWIVGRFAASDPFGQWQELEPADLIGVSGPEVCAPAVNFNQMNSKPWNMYIQTKCFGPEGYIAIAESYDGKTFHVNQTASVDTSIIPMPLSPIVGIYDAGISEITWEGIEYETLVFSGYRQVGSGDVYVTMRPKTFQNIASWLPAKMILKQEAVPFHNHPSRPDFEWGLEGAKIIKLTENLFLLTGVCFLPTGLRGSRQRVFWGLSTRPDGEYIPWTLPLHQSFSNFPGEYGHPDIWVENQHLMMTYQMHQSWSSPWQLGIASFSLYDVVDTAKQFLSTGIGGFDIHSQIFISN